jgi:hypothetical protein
MWSWLKASEFQPHHLYNCILPHEKKVVLAPTPTPTSLYLPPSTPQPFQHGMTFFSVQGFPRSHLFIKFWFHYEIVVEYYWFPFQNILWQNRTHVPAPSGTCWCAFNTLKRVLNDKISNVVFNIFCLETVPNWCGLCEKKCFFLENSCSHFFMTLNTNLLNSYSNLWARTSRIWPKLSHEIDVVITILDSYWIYDVKLYKFLA